MQYIGYFGNSPKQPSQNFTYYYPHHAIFLVREAVVMTTLCIMQKAMKDPFQI